MSEEASHPGPPVPQLEHARLKPFEGTFRSTVKLWMGPSDPIVELNRFVSQDEFPK